MKTFVWITVVFVSVFLAPVGARAADESLWERLDRKFYKGHLCEAIVDGDSATVRRKSCSFAGCDEWSYRIVTSCRLKADGTAQATIDLFKTDGSHFSTVTLTEAQWLASDRNFLRMHAKAVESYGMNFHLTGIDEQGAYLKASYEVTNAKLGKQESGYWLVGDGPFITQVVEKQQVRAAAFKEVTTDRVLQP